MNSTGRPGYRKVLVDSRGRVQSEIEVIQPQAGQDLISTIDLDLQISAEQQLAASVTKRGVLIAMDPNNGELLALASAPSFDPNVFTQGSKIPSAADIIAAYCSNERRSTPCDPGKFHPGLLEDP